MTSRVKFRVVAPLHKTASTLCTRRACTWALKRRRTKPFSSKLSRTRDHEPSTKVPFLELKALKTISLHFMIKLTSRTSTLTTCQTQRHLFLKKCSLRLMFSTAAFPTARQSTKASITSATRQQVQNLQSKRAH